MTKLNAKQTTIHNRALKLSRTHRKIEQQLVEILIQVEETKLYKLLNKPSMFLYATELLNLSEAVAFSLIAVARKARAVPALRKAIAEQRISTSKASRIVAFIDQNNAGELIQFASCHTSQEIDFEVEKRNPRAKVRDKVKVISEHQVQLSLTVDKATFAALKRVQSLMAQKGKPATLSESVSTITEHYLNTQDPARKAERAVKKGLCLNRVQTTRKPSAAEKHAVFARDQGRCTHRDTEGMRCRSDRWIDVHHIVPVSQGGGNEPENLTTLCSFHHDLVHQLSLPSDGPTPLKTGLGPPALVPPLHFRTRN